MNEATSTALDPKIEQKARELLRQKQQAFYEALKARNSPHTDAAGRKLEAIEAAVVGVTCKILTVSEPFIWGNTSAQIYYTQAGTQLSFYGEGWGIGLGAGGGGGGGTATIPADQLVGPAAFEVEFTTVQATAVYYKPDGVACSVFVLGAFPGAGYLKGHGTWKSGW